MRRHTSALVKHGQASERCPAGFKITRKDLGKTYSSEIWIREGVSLLLVEHSAGAWDRIITQRFGQHFTPTWSHIAALIVSRARLCIPDGHRQSLTTALPSPIDV
jgi:hypothetical protein